MKTTAYELNVDNAMLFFELCHELNLTTEQDRVALLQAMAELGRVKRAWTTKRTKDQLIKDLSKHYKTIVVKSANENPR